MARQTSMMVLLIEDDMDIAGTISDYLALEGIECDHAFDGEAGFEMARKKGYEVVLLDVNLPFRDGLEICRGLRADGVDTPVLMLTARDTLDNKLDGFKAGADDYLVKPFAMEELVARIQVLSRRRSGEARRFTLADLQLDFERREVHRAGREIRISPTSWQILELLAQKSPAVVTKARLEMALWQGEPPDSDALKVHMYRLRKKLDKPFDRDLIQTVPGQGFALRES